MTYSRALHRGSLPGVTVVSFLCFIGIVAWAYSGRQKTRFDEAANLPFADDDMQQRTLNQSSRAGSQQYKPVTRVENDHG